MLYSGQASGQAEGRGAFQATRRHGSVVVVVVVVVANQETRFPSNLDLQETQDEKPAPPPVRIFFSLVHV